MKEYDIEMFLDLNEPSFDFNGKQYSVCHVNGVYGTWDSDGNTFDFHSLSDLLENWIFDGKPFRQVVEMVMAEYNYMPE